MRKYILIIVTFLLFFGINVQAQVGIGTDEPHESSVLEMNSKNSGLLIPRMYLSERNAIANPAEGLMIFNISDNCWNFYNGQKWKNACGDVLPAVVIPVETGSPECDDWQEAFNNSGRYIQGSPTTSGNVVNLPIEVTSEGSLNITVITTNGYAFSYYNPLVSVGRQTVPLQASGTPVIAGTNALIIAINGEVHSCQPVITVEENVPPVRISTDCSKTKVNGRYIETINTAVAGNNITVTATNLSNRSEYTYNYYTEPVDGVAFFATGTISPGQTKEIVLTPMGTFTSSGSKQFTVKSLNTSETTACKAVVEVLHLPRTINVVGFGSVTDDFAIGNPNNNLTKMLREQYNFGTLPRSTVLVRGINVTYKSATASSDNITSAINNDKADIIIINYISTINAAAIATLTDFINNKNGVVIYTREGATTANLINSVFGTTTTSDTTGGYSSYPMVISDDPILKGPFMDLTAQTNPYFGSDGTDGRTFQNYPSNAIVLVKQRTNNNAFLLRHPTKGLMVGGDGGIFAASSTYPPSATRWPFAINGYNNPVVNPHQMDSRTTYNSLLFANYIAWAIDYLDKNKP